MAATKLTAKTELTSAADDDLAMLVDVSDTTGDASGTSKKIQVSNLMLKAPVQSVNGATGTVVLNMDDVNDVNATSPTGGDILEWNGTNAWTASGKLHTLYELIKEGTDTTIKNGAGTDSELKLEPTKATVSTGITKIVLTETSPGDMEFLVATDATGTTAFTAVHIDGSTTANQADLIIKLGCYLKFDDGLYTQWLKPSSGAGSNIAITLPDKTGVLAVQSEIPTSVTDLTDVSSAGSGAIITTVERNKLAGIAAGAEVNTVDSVNAQTGVVVLDADDISDASTTNKFTTAADASKLAGIEVGADVTDETNVKAALDGMTLTSASIASGDRMLIQDANASYEQKYVLYDNFALKQYVTDEIVSNQNITMDAGVSVAINKIVDVMGDTLADPSNANSKKMLGFHTGSGIVVLRGMVDANNSITGATAGSPLWIGASGAFSATAPTTATYYSRVVGYYIGTLVGGEVMCYFDPSKDWVQID